MGSITAKIQELIEDGRFIEQRRKPFPGVAINFFDAVYGESEGVDRRTVTANDKDAGTEDQCTAEGEQKKGVSKIEQKDLIIQIMRDDEDSGLYENKL